MASIPITYIFVIFFVVDARAAHCRKTSLVIAIGNNNIFIETFCHVDEDADLQVSDGWPQGGEDFPSTR